MFLTYIDESGKPNLTDSENEFVLAAITIHEYDYKVVKTNLERVKLKYFPKIPPQNIEIHATDIISRKGFFKDLDLEQRLQMLKDVLSTLSNFKCNINCVVIRKDKLRPGQTEINDMAYKYLFERLCTTHIKLNEELEKKSKHAEYGLIFTDSIQPKFDNKIKSHMRSLITYGTEYRDNQYIIEDIVFVDSKYRSISQLVDCIAFCIRRYEKIELGYECKDSERTYYNECFRLIEPHIRKNGIGTIKGAGLKIYP